MTFFICLVLIVLLYIKHKLTHPFWSTQPVSFKLKFLNKGKGVLTDNLPSSKWLDLNQTFITDNTDKAVRDNICKFASNAYRTEKAKHTTNTNRSIGNSIGNSIGTCKDLEHYLINHSYPAYLGIYRKSIKAQDVISDESSPPEYDNIAGIITAVPLVFTVFKNSKQLNIHNKKVNLLNYVYYVDNLIVDSEYRGKKVPCKLITGIHHKIKQVQSPCIVGLFKRENDVSPFLKEFTKYKSQWFNIEYWFKSPFSLHPSVSFLEISRQNINLLYSFLLSTCNKYFACFIHPDISSLITLIENKVITIYSLMKGDTFCAVYCFKTNDTDIVLVNSINANSSLEFFIHGFYHCLERIRNITHFNTIRIEGLSHCSLIIDHILTVNSGIRYSNVSWYLYNYNMNSMKSSEVFILV